MNCEAPTTLRIIGKIVIEYESTRSCAFVEGELLWGDLPHSRTLRHNTFLRSDGVIVSCCSEEDALKDDFNPRGSFDLAGFWDNTEEFRKHVGGRYISKEVFD
jgi:hypothetical protein